MWRPKRNCAVRKATCILEPFGSPALSDLLLQDASMAFNLVFLADLLLGLVHGANRNICEELVLQLPVLIDMKAFKEVYKALGTIWDEGMKGLEVYEDHRKGFGIRIQNAAEYEKRSDATNMGVAICLDQMELPHFTYFNQILLNNPPRKFYICGPLRLSNYVQEDPHKKKICGGLDGNDDVLLFEFLHMSKGNSWKSGDAIEWNYGGISEKNVLSWNGPHCRNSKTIKDHLGLFRTILSKDDNPPVLPKALVCPECGERRVGTFHLKLHVRAKHRVQFESSKTCSN